jgi:hypothetical protein
MLIIIIGWSSEYPFWAMRLGSIPSTLNVFLVVEGDTIGVVALEVRVAGNRYLRFFCRKTGYHASSTHQHKSIPVDIWRETNIVQYYLFTPLAGV